MKNKSQLNKKLILLFLLCFFSMSSAFGQCRETSQKQKEKAIKEYNNRRYQEARKLFVVARKCPDLTNKERASLDSWIHKCDAASSKGNANKPDPIITPITIPPAKSEVEFSHISCSTQCNTQGGVSLKVCFQVKGMKQKHIGVRCLLSPERGKPIPRKDSDQSEYYTVFGGRLGIEKEYLVASDDEYFSETYFFPFRVIDFGDEYVTQALDVVFYVFEPSDNTAIEKMSPIMGGVLRDMFSVTPVAFTIDGYTRNLSIPVDYDGGVYSPQIATCGCDIQWGGDIPDWITIDKNGTDVHVSENNSSQQREAVLRIESNAGWGNVIMVRIRQNGR